MGRFTVILRNCFRSLQFGGAVAACAIYASNYDELTKDYRWNFAITTSAFSVAGTIIQAVFISYFPDEFDDGWIILSGFCSGILFLFWTGVLGTFARSFIHRDPNYSHGIRMMQVAVYIDAANMVIWFSAVAYMIGMLAKYERSTVASRRNTEELHQLRRSPSTTFVPYGWGSVDIEAQTSHGPAQTENPPPPPPINMFEDHRNIPDPVPPVPHPPLHTTTGDRYVTHFRDMEGARSVTEILPVLPDELRHYPPIPPPMRSPDTSTLYSLTRESQPYAASPRLSLQHRHSSYRPLGYPKFEQVADTYDRLNTYSTTPFSISSQGRLSKYSWPLEPESPEPTKECPICIEEHSCWTGFPFRIARACKSHEQEACRDCIARTIAAEIDNNISGQIHCYKCRAVLEYEEVKALASPTTFERYEAMGLRSFVSSNPNFVWCQSPHCEAGQEHVGGVDQPIVTCQACGFKTCFKHQIPWHEEMLCEEYDERLPLSDGDQRLRAQQEAASIAAVHEVTKPCANKKCRAPIQKNMGCDHMTCRACKHEFCWVCGANWGGVHLSGCGHR